MTDAQLYWSMFLPPSSDGAYTADPARLGELAIAWWQRAAKDTIACARAGDVVQMCLQALPVVLFSPNLVSAETSTVSVPSGASEPGRIIHDLPAFTRACGAAVADIQTLLRGDMFRTHCLTKSCAVALDICKLVASASSGRTGGAVPGQQKPARRKDDGRSVSASDDSGSPALCSEELLAQHDRLQLDQYAWGDARSRSALMLDGADAALLAPRSTETDTAAVEPRSHRHLSILGEQCAWIHSQLQQLLVPVASSESPDVLGAHPTPVRWRYLDGVVAACAHQIRVSPQACNLLALRNAMDAVSGACQLITVTSAHNVALIRPGLRDFMLSYVLPKLQRNVEAASQQTSVSDAKDSGALAKLGRLFKRKPKAVSGASGAAAAQSGAPCGTTAGSPDGDDALLDAVAGRCMSANLRVWLSNTTAGSEHNASWSEVAAKALLDCAAPAGYAGVPHMAVEQSVISRLLDTGVCAFLQQCIQDVLEEPRCKNIVPYLLRETRRETAALAVSRSTLAPICSIPGSASAVNHITPLSDGEHEFCMAVPSSGGTASFTASLQQGTDSTPWASSIYAVYGSQHALRYVDPMALWTIRRQIQPGNVFSGCTHLHSSAGSSYQIYESACVVGDAAFIGTVWSLDAVLDLTIEKGVYIAGPLLSQAGATFAKIVLQHCGDIIQSSHLLMRVSVGSTCFSGRAFQVAGDKFSGDFLTEVAAAVRSSEPVTAYVLLRQQQQERQQVRRHAHRYSSAAAVDDAASVADEADDSSEPQYTYRPCRLQFVLHYRNSYSAVFSTCRGDRPAPHWESVFFSAADAVTYMRFNQLYHCTPAPSRADVDASLPPPAHQQSLLYGQHLLQRASAIALQRGCFDVAWVLRWRASRLQLDDMSGLSSSSSAATTTRTGAALPGQGLKIAGSMSRLLRDLIEIINAVQHVVLLLSVCVCGVGADGGSPDTLSRSELPAAGDHQAVLWRLEDAGIGISDILRPVNSGRAVLTAPDGAAADDGGADDATEPAERVLPGNLQPALLRADVELLVGRVCQDVCNDSYVCAYPGLREYLLALLSGVVESGLIGVKARSTTSADPAFNMQSMSKCLRALEALRGTLSALADSVAYLALAADESSLM